MSENPGSSSSPGFCHIRRQWNRSAQKQIICPIYRGWAADEPLQDGAGTKISTPQSAPERPLKDESKLIPSTGGESRFSWIIQTVTAARDQQPASRSRPHE